MLHLQGFSNLIPTRQCARQHPEYMLVSSLITYANSLCLWIKSLATMCWRHLESNIIRCSQGLFLEGGGGGGVEILRKINGQDHRTSMAKISASICSIWSRSLRSSECIGKQCSTHQQYIVENHKNTKQWVFGQTAQVHILLENLAYGQWWLRK